MKSLKPIPPFSIYDYTDEGDEFTGSHFVKKNEKKINGFTFSINASDFNNAQANGVKIEIAVSVQSIVYNEQTYAFINGVEYEMYRFYPNGNYTEIYYKRKKVNWVNLEL